MDEKRNLLKNFNIHEGEAEAIVLLRERSGDILGTDDFQTLKTCKVFGIKYITTPLFIILRCKKKILDRDGGLRKISQLEEYGWYSDNLIQVFKQKIQKEAI